MLFQLPTRFTVGLSPSVLVQHCSLWRVSVLFLPSSLLGFFSRFTVGLHSPAPFPVSLLAVSPRPCALSPVNVDKVDIPARTNVLNRNVRNVRNPPSGRLAKHPENKPFPTGNRPRMTNNSATESTFAQGMPECEELYSVDQNVHIAHNLRFLIFPTLPRLRAQGRDSSGQEYHSGKRKTVRNREETTVKTTVKQGITGYPGFLLWGVKRRLFTLRRGFGTFCSNLSKRL